jgi:hypothetical protein
MTDLNSTANATIMYSTEQVCTISNTRRAQEHASTGNFLYRGCRTRLGPVRTTARHGTALHDTETGCEGKGVPQSTPTTVGQREQGRHRGPLLCVTQPEPEPIPNPRQEARYAQGKDLDVASPCVRVHARGKTARQCRPCRPKRVAVIQ